MRKTAAPANPSMREDIEEMVYDCNKSVDLFFSYFHHVAELVEWPENVKLLQEIGVMKDLGRGRGGSGRHLL